MKWIVWGLKSLGFGMGVTTLVVGLASVFIVCAGILLTMVWDVLVTLGLGGIAIFLVLSLTLGLTVRWHSRPSDRKLEDDLD